MKSHSAFGCGRVAVLAMWLGCQYLIPSARADEGSAPPLIEFALGLPGKQAILSWAGELGARYHVEKSTDLGAAAGGGGGWTRVAFVEATGPMVEWRDPQAVTERCFYRVTQPQAEVFSIQPPVLSSEGGTIVVQGQRLPADALLALEIEGLGTITFPLEALTTTTWRALVTAALSPGARVISASVQDSLGNTVAMIDQQLTITGSGRAEDAPPSLPPAAPLSMAIRGKVKDIKTDPSSIRTLAVATDDQDIFPEFTHGTIGILGKKSYDMDNARSVDANRSSGGTPFVPHDDSDFSISNDDVDMLRAANDDCDDGNPDPLGFAAKCKGSGASGHRTAPTPSGLPGEVSFQQTDLALSSPAGPPLAWVRTYRSMKPVNSGHGGQWDFSYNIRIETLPPGAGASAERVRIHDGGGRSDIFYRRSDGTFGCDGFFREGSFSGDVFTLTFADTGRWVFKPLNSARDAGRIDKIIDRNGVALTCAYDPAGMLESVSNPFGSSISVTWSATGDRIERITDHGGRSYDYSYYSSADPDGGEGMLERVTPPGSGPLRFTYSTGTGDSRLDGNLLAAYDGESRLIEAFTYSSATDTLSLSYDTCASHDRTRIGSTGPVCVFSREPLPADQQPYGGYRVFEVDEIGRVNEFVCDAMHRTVSRRIFSGFTIPGTPVSSTTLTLTGKLRASDPDWFEYSCDFNADHLPTRYTLPDGSQALVIYEREMQKTTPVRERGNARVLTLRSPSGQTRSVSCDYEPGFGTPESSMPDAVFKTAMVKAGRNPRSPYPMGQSRAASSGSSPTTDDIGRIAARPGEIKIRPKGWDGSVNGSALVWSPRSNFTIDDDDGGGAAARGTGLHDSAKGPLTIPTNGEGARHTPFQNKSRSKASLRAGMDDADQDCNGGADDSDEGMGFFRRILDRGEAGDNVALTRLVTAHGQTYQWTYDTHGNPLSVTTPVPGYGKVYQYNTLGQCVSVEIQDGARVVRDDHSHSPTTGDLEIIIQRVVGSPGPHLTTTFVRDSYGRVTDVTDPGGATWSYEYNALDLCTRIQSPPVPSRISTNFSYDHSGKLIRCDIDHLEPDGTPVTSNPAYSTFWQHDSRGRLARISTEERPVNPGPSDTPDTLGIENFAACDISRDLAGQIIKLSTPAVCRGQATDEVIDFQYDERGLLFRRIAGNLPGTTPLVLQSDYDAKGRLVRRSTLSGSPEEPTEVYEYDGFGRLASATDPMGNVSTLDYDNTGAVTVSFFGELNDVLGSAGNQLLAQSKTRTRVEVLKSNRISNPSYKSSKCDSIKSATSGVSVTAAFFGYVTRDETISVQRFTPEGSEPPATDLTILQRSPAGLLESITINGDLVQSREYDGYGRLQRCFDGARSVMLTRDDRGHVLLCGETDHFRVVGMPSKSYSLVFIRDALGRVTSRNDGTGNAWLYSYDSLGRVRVVSPPGRQPVLYEYDGSSTTGPYSVRALCDIAGTGALENLGTCFTPCGDLRSVSNSSGDTTFFHRDACGRVVSTDFPDGTHETTTYDARGFIATATFPDSSSCDLTTDAAGRVISETWTPAVGVAPSPPTIYQHDGLGRCVHLEQGSNFVSFTYDSVSNRVKTVSRKLRSMEMSNFKATFSHRGRTQVVYPGGDSYDEARGVHGELLSVTKTGQSTPKIAMEHVGRRVWRVTRDDGTVTTHSYRSDGEAPPAGAPDASFDRCVETTVTKGGTTLAHVVTRRAPDQAVTRIENSYSADPDAVGRFKDITRDGLGRLTACVTSVREITGGPVLAVDSVSYVRNADGLRVSEIRNGVVGSYAQNDALPPGDRQMGQYSSWPGGAIEWDDAGNLLRMQRGTDPGLHFECDVQGRVLAVRETDASGLPTNLLAEFEYDPLGRVMLHKIHRGSSLPPLETSFVYDGNVCIQELSSTGAVETSFVCADGEQVAFETGGSSYHSIEVSNSTIVTPSVNERVCTCPLGMRVQPAPGYRASILTNSSGAVVRRYDADDSGKPVFLDAAGLPSTDVGPIKWMAPEVLWVPETGMFHGAGGVYSPDLGTWVTKPKKKPASPDPNDDSGSYSGSITVTVAADE